MTVCMYCDEEVYGGKGDWWHTRTHRMVCDLDDPPPKLASPDLPPLPNTIPLSECQKGEVYAIESRNLKYGVFNGKTGYIGWRTKFDSTYLFTEYHEDTGSPFGTVRPLLKVGEIDSSIPLIERYPQTYCSRCGEHLEFVKNNPDGQKGKWFHTYQVGSGDITCDDPIGPGVVPFSMGTYQPLASAIDNVIEEWEEENRHPIDVRLDVERNGVSR